MNFETLGRLSRIEEAIARLQVALDNLQAQVTELKAPAGAYTAELSTPVIAGGKRETLTLRKRG